MYKKTSARKSTVILDNGDLPSLFCPRPVEDVLNKSPAIGMRVYSSPWKTISMGLLRYYRQDLLLRMWRGRSYEYKLSFKGYFRLLYLREKLIVKSEERTFLRCMSRDRNAAQRYIGLHQVSEEPLSRASHRSPKVEEEPDKKHVPAEGFLGDVSCVLRRLLCEGSTHQFGDLT